eukprot:1416725-Prymnesium_polylepis.1
MCIRDRVYSWTSRPRRTHRSARSAGAKIYRLKDLQRPRNVYFVCTSGPQPVPERGVERTCRRPG